MHTFKLKILTPDKKLFEGDVLSFTVPTQSGEITVLKNHAPLVTLISIGEIKVKQPLLTSPINSGGTEQEHKFLVQGGVIDVKSDTQDFEVVVLADQIVDAELNNDLDAEIERAKNAMSLKQDEIDFALEEATIERNLFIKRMKGR